MINQLGIKFIGFRNKSYNNYGLSFDALSKYYENNVLFLAFDTKRADIYNYNISTMHYLPFIGNDVYAVETPKFISKNDKISLKKMENIKLFNPSNLIIEPLITRVSQVDTILKEMGEEKNNKLRDILQQQKINDNSINEIHSFSKIHELKSSHNEFKSLQEYTKTNSTIDYIKEKTYLNKSLDKMKKSILK